MRMFTMLLESYKNDYQQMAYTIAETLCRVGFLIHNFVCTGRTAIEFHQSALSIQALQTPTQ